VGAQYAEYYASIFFSLPILRRGSRACPELVEGFKNRQQVRNENLIFISDERTDFADSYPPSWWGGSVSFAMHNFAFVGGDSW
jgi:hypothetical protein